MQSALDTLSVTHPTARDTAIALLDADAAQLAPQGIERVMLASDKLPVVLAVVLLIWFGLLFLLFRTDRRISRIEKELNETETSA